MTGDASRLLSDPVPLVSPNPPDWLSPVPQVLYSVLSGSLWHHIRSCGLMFTQIVQRTDTSFVRTGELEHPYPPTKIMWSPDKSHSSTDLLATTGRTPPHPHLHPQLHPHLHLVRSKA